MPSNIVSQLIAKVAQLEARVESLMTWQKMQMGALVTIFVTIVASLVLRN